MLNGKNRLDFVVRDWIAVVIFCKCVSHLATHIEYVFDLCCLFPDGFPTQITTSIGKIDGDSIFHDSARRAVLVMIQVQ